MLSQVDMVKFERRTRLLSMDDDVVGGGCWISFGKEGNVLDSLIKERLSPE